MGVEGLSQHLFDSLHESFGASPALKDHPAGNLGERSLFKCQGHQHC